MSRSVPVEILYTIPCSASGWYSIWNHNCDVCAVLERPSIGVGELLGKIRGVTLLGRTVKGKCRLY